MTPIPQFPNEQTTPSRVSILARLVPSLAYVIGMLGAALTAVGLMRVMEAMRNAESAGIGAVARGILEADMVTLVGLCLAVFLSFVGMLVIVIRAFMTTRTTATPSAWFFVVAGGMSFIPLLLEWEAQSILVGSIMGSNVSLSASSIQLCLTLTLVTSAAFTLILLVLSFVPLPSVLRAKRKYAPIIVLALMELALIGMAVAFQMRVSWLRQVYIGERF